MGALKVKVDGQWQYIPTVGPVGTGAYFCGRGTAVATPGTDGSALIPLTLERAAGFTLSSGRAVCGVAGTYLAVGFVTSAGASVQYWSGMLRVYRAGVLQKEVAVISGAADDYWSIGGSAYIFDLAVNDTVELWIQSALSRSSDSRSWLNIIPVGAQGPQGVPGAQGIPGMAGGASFGTPTKIINANYTLLTTDIGSTLNGQNGARITLTLPAFTAVDWPLGGSVRLYAPASAIELSGQLQIGASSSLTTYGLSQSVVNIIRLSTNRWLLSGEGVNQPRILGSVKQTGNAGPGISGVADIPGLTTSFFPLAGHRYRVFFGAAMNGSAGGQHLRVVLADGNNTEWRHAGGVAASDAATWGHSLSGVCEFSKAMGNAFTPNVAVILKVRGTAVSGTWGASIYANTEYGMLEIEDLGADP